MARTATLPRDKATSIELESDVREYLMQRVKAEGRTIKWLVNNALRNEMLAEEALKEQADLFVSKKS